MIAVLGMTPVFSTGAAKLPRIPPQAARGSRTIRHSSWVPMQGCFEASLLPAWSRLSTDSASNTAKSRAVRKTRKGRIDLSSSFLLREMAVEARNLAPLTASAFSQGASAKPRQPLRATPISRGSSPETCTLAGWLACEQVESFQFLNGACQNDRATPDLARPRLGARHCEIVFEKKALSTDHDPRARRSIRLIETVRQAHLWIMRHLSAIRVT